MKEVKSPPYFAISGEYADLADCLPDSQRLAFYDGIHKDYNHLRNGEPVSEYSHDIAGEITRKGQGKMIEAYEAYIRRANSNPNGKNQHSKPFPEAYTTEQEAYASETEANTYTDRGPDLNQSNHNQSNKNKSNSINQIKSNLLRRGYRAEEIDNAIRKANGRQIRKERLENYLITTIDNDRKEKPVRILNAQQYEQRDYTETADEIASRADDTIESLEYITEQWQKQKETK